MRAIWPSVVALIVEVEARGKAAPAAGGEKITNKQKMSNHRVCVINADAMFKRLELCESVSSDIFVILG